MSKKDKKPKPGAILKQTLEKINYIKTIINDVSQNGSMESAKLFDAFIESEAHSEVMPDEYKMIIDTLHAEAECIAAISERAFHQSVMLRAAAIHFKEYIKNHLIKSKEDSISGDTWKFDLVKGQPEVVVDETKLPIRYKRTEKRVNEKEIMKQISAGKKVIGVKVKTGFDVVASVIKKGEKDVYA